MNFESLTISNNMVFGVWTELFADEDTGNVIAIERHQYICELSDFDKFKHKRSRIYSGFQVYYTYDQNTDEFPVFGFRCKTKSSNDFSKLLNNL